MAKIKGYEDDIQIILAKINKKIGKKLPAQVILTGSRTVHNGRKTLSLPLGRKVTKVTMVRIIGESDNQDVEIIFKDKVWGSTRHTIRYIFDGTIHFPIFSVGEDAFFTIVKK